VDGLLVNAGCPAAAGELVACGAWERTVVSDELPARFIGAPIGAVYDHPPPVEKRPGPPDGFVWAGRAYRVVALLREWHDYRLRGKSEALPTPTLPQVRKWRARGRSAHGGALRCGDCARTCGRVGSYEQGSFRATAARRHGTWGAGRDYYRVRTDTGEVFDIYYDRAPKGAAQGKGAWFLFRQILQEQR